MQNIPIPDRLNLNFIDYRFIAELFSTIESSIDTVIILDFSNCKYYDAGFIAFLGGIYDYFKGCGKHIYLNFPYSSVVKRYFCNSGLYSYICADTSMQPNQNAVPFCNIKIVDFNVTNNYTNKFMELAPIALSEGAKQFISTNIIELFTNAIDHSESPLGCYACGHWMPKHNTLVFSVYDSGIGIPNKIKRKFQGYSSEDAIEWALQRGHSTIQLENDIPRGLGLYNLKDFIRLNKGTLRILSNDIYYEYSDGGSETFKVINHPIHGTLITMKVLPDSANLYCLKGEQV